MTYQESFGGYDNDPQGAKAILNAKVVQISGQAAAINAWYQPVRFFCRQGLLYLDYSKLAADPQALFLVYSGDTPLNVERGSGSLSFALPIIWSDPQPDSYSAGVNIGLATSSRGSVIETVNVGGVARSKSEGLFLLDRARNVLLPLQYAGNDAGTRRVVGQVVGAILELYCAPDFAVPSGWRKTTVDLKQSLIWWSPTSRPSNATFGK